MKSPNLLKLIRLISAILFFLWMYGSFFSPFAKSNPSSSEYFTGILIYSIIFLLPAVGIEIALHFSLRRVNEQNKRRNSKNLSQEKKIANSSTKCTECEAFLTSSMNFCPKCGKRIDKNSSVLEDSSNLCTTHFRDIFGKTIEVLPIGIHIYKNSGSDRFEKIIPYTDIISISYKKASVWSAGYFSIVTATAGVRPDEICRVTALKQSYFLSTDENTICFHKGDSDTVAEIIEAMRVRHLQSFARYDDYAFAPSSYYASVSHPDVKK